SPLQKPPAQPDSSSPGRNASKSGGDSFTAEHDPVEQSRRALPQVGLNSLTTSGFWAGEGGGVLDREIAASGFGEGGIGGESHDDPGAATRIADPQSVQKSFEQSGERQVPAQARGVETGITAVRGDARARQTSAEFLAEHDVHEFWSEVQGHGRPPAV